MHYKMRVSYVVGYILALVCGALCSNVQFLYTPTSIFLPQHASLSVSDAALVTSQLLGLSAEKPSGWTGEGDALNRPKAAAIFVISVQDEFGPTFVHQIGGSLHTQKYMLKQNEEENPDFESASSNIRETFGSKATIFNLPKDAKRLSEITVDVPLKTKESTLHGELENIYAVQKWLQTNAKNLNDGKPDLYIFHINGLKKAQTLYGSDEWKTAQKELYEAIELLSLTLKEVYESDVLIELLTHSIEETQMRIKRQQPKIEAATEAAFLGIDQILWADENWGVTFNIVFWSSLFLAIVILFIGVGMFTFEPGKDTIIYRLTMTRPKKD